MDLPQVEPVFLNARDIIDFKTEKEHEVCEAVTHFIAENKLIAIQRIRMVWRIYVSDNASRITLLTSHVEIRGQTVQVYTNNPYRAGITDGQSDEDVIKITIKEVPLSKGNVDIAKYLEEKGIKLKKPIQYGKIRNSKNELTNFLNGDRIAFAEPFTRPLPRKTFIGGSNATILHRGQKKWQKPLCNNCFQEGHFRNECKSDPCCVVCKVPGHKPGNAICVGTAKQQHKNVVPFQGFEDPLSNYYPCELKVFGVEVKSAEHGYQYSKAIQSGHDDVANHILSAKTALQAKRIASSLPFNPNWESVKEEQMSQVLTAKLQQCKEFALTLKDTGSKVIAEAVPGDFFWSAGLCKEDILLVKKNNWPGRNRMGKILTELRSNLTKDLVKKSNKKNRGKSSSQRNDKSESDSDYYYSD